MSAPIPPVPLVPRAGTAPPVVVPPTGRASVAATGAAAPRAAAVAPSDTTAPGLGPVLVLFADDNATFRAGLVRALGRCPDLELVATEADGVAALTAARIHRPDVVVVDDRMPGLTGLEVAAAVVADPALEGVRVVLLTARADPEVRMEALSAGAVACLDKASSRRETCAAILTIAGRPVPASAR